MNMDEERPLRMMVVYESSRSGFFVALVPGDNANLPRRSWRLSCFVAD